MTQVLGKVKDRVKVAEEVVVDRNLEDTSRLDGECWRGTEWPTIAGDAGDAGDGA